jgi:hypothetical protein
MSYKLNNSSELSLGYGLHSRLEPLNVYFVKSESAAYDLPNKDLDFTKAHHWVLGYNLKLSDHLIVKAEPYYQLLFDVPIVENSTVALINRQNHWFVTDRFVNGGKGRNMGVDMTLEQYISKGFYFLITASVFDSKYRTDRNIWYNTRYNKGFLLNTLVGKEYKVGRARQDILSFNIRMTLQGGERFSPIDHDASAADRDVVYNETTPFSKQTPPSAVSHLTVNYKWNKPKSSRELSLKIINATNYKEFLGHRYNLTTSQVEEFREALMIPNLSYKISF